jgi:hypothetical protein
VEDGEASAVVEETGGGEEPAARVEDRPSSDTM